MRKSADTTLILFLFTLYMYLSSWLFPTWQLSLLFPALVMLSSSKASFRSALYGCMLGTLIDLCTHTYPLGFYALACTLSTLGITRIRHSFAVAKPAALLLLFFLSSLFGTLLLVALSYFFQRPLHYTLETGSIDLLLCPLVDTLWAALIFQLIPFLIKHHFFIANIRKWMTKEKHG